MAILLNNDKSYIIYCIMYVRKQSLFHHCNNVQNLQKSNMAQKIPMLLGVNYSKLSRVLCNWHSKIVNAVSSGH